MTLEGVRDHPLVSRIMAARALIDLIGMRLMTVVASEALMSCYVSAVRILLE